MIFTTSVHLYTGFDKHTTVDCREDLINTKVRNSYKLRVYVRQMSGEKHS